MLVDAAKGGDVEIPVFCYEPKLGEPVGACRMCLVEIEGIPKLQTACSTPVRDGMVVYTQTDQVKEAQNAVVEFLLVNHPLDCPVCDKGGECPLQDIAMGWGPGKSRFTDPKRHFQKPLELSPLIAIDRERCILCYRCVRFSQEVAEDEQLQLLERGDKSFVGTFDERPYIAPFHGNIIELCPVGALTSYTYRFRARPWDIEDAGSVCTLCPSQCNVKFTVRDERVLRVLARDNTEVDDGWLCDKGRFAFQMFGSSERITQPMARGGDGSLTPISWEEATAVIAKAFDAAGSAERRPGRRRHLQRGGLAGAADRPRLGAPNVDCSASPVDRGAAGGALAPRARPEDRGPRLRRRDPRARHRPPARDADPRPSDPQGGAPERHQARGRLRATHGPRRRSGSGCSLRPGRRRRRSSARWPPRSAPRASRRTGPTRSRAPRRSPSSSGRLPTRRSSGASGSGAARAPPRRSTPAPGRSRCTSGSARGCSRCPRSRTAAASARSAACPAPPPGSPPPSSAAAPPRSRRASPPATSTPCSCSNADPVRTHPDTEGWRQAPRQVVRRLDRDVRRRVHQARRHRPPRRDPRREGGHRHPPRRPPPAPAPERPAPRRGPSRLAAPHRALVGAGPRPRPLDCRPRSSTRSRRKSRSTTRSPTRRSAAPVSGGRNETPAPRGLRPTPSTAPPPSIPSRGRRRPLRDRMQPQERQHGGRIAYGRRIRSRRGCRRPRRRLAAWHLP